MDYTEWLPWRLTQLRVEKGVSARDMSLSLGQSESYINKIENRRIMPSMAGFFYICDYLGLQPSEFFCTEAGSPGKMAQAAALVGKLPSDKADHILAVLRDLTEDKH